LYYVYVYVDWYYLLDGLKGTRYLIGHIWDKNDYIYYRMNDEYVGSAMLI